MLVLARPTDDLRARWARATALGVRADSPAYPEGASDGELVARRDRLADAFREERDRFSPIVGGFAARSLVAIVADPEGVILTAEGRDAFDDTATRVRLVEGATWSESARGTNAIGTAIVERRAVAVIGAAHYEARNRGLFCYAKPIFDAYGDLVAVLDVSGPLARHDDAIGAAVEAAGLALERALSQIAFARSGAGALATIERLVTRSMAVSLLIDAWGRVRVSSPSARGALGLDAASPVTCADVFSVSFEQLAALAASAQRGMRYETKRGAYRVELEPIAGPGGRALAIVAHFEPLAPGPVHPPTLSRPPDGAAPRRQPGVPTAFDALVANDARVLAAKADAARLARTDLPVVLLAETGTGKELFARAIHAASARASGPFVALNCGALGGTLLESELFGYAPGAYTGALRAGSPGKLGAADGGTLFLDEIAEMPDAVQAALLRVLDDGEYYRVGDPRPRKTSFRLLGATCRDLPALVANGSFRRDLFFRVCSATIGIPPLRERTDRAHLARGLLRALDPSATLAVDAIDFIETHPWPGNVRELKSALAHAHAMADGGPIARSHLPRPLFTAPPRAAPGSKREELLRDAIEDALRREDGNVTRAARRLGVARSTVQRALKARGG